MSIDSTEHMRIAAFQELQQAIRIRRINIELFEHLCSSIQWILHYARKNNFPVPDVDKMEALLDKAEEIDEKTPL